MHYFCCFITGFKRCMRLHFNMTTPDPIQQAPSHISSPATSKLFPGLLCPRVKPSRAHLRWVGQTCSRQSKCPCKRAGVVPGTQAGWVAIPSQVIHNLFQSMPKRCWAVHRFSRRKHPLLICVYLRCKNTVWKVSWTKRMLKPWTLISCSDHLQNETWWAWFLGWILEHQLNSKTNQTCIYLLFWTVYIMHLRQLHTTHRLAPNTKGIITLKIWVNFITSNYRTQSRSTVNESRQ